MGLQATVIDTPALGARWSHLLDVDRGLATHLGYEAVQWSEDGWYALRDGTRVDIAAQVQAARARTHTVLPHDVLPEPTPHRGRTVRLAVANETTLAAARSLHDQGLRPAALNMANGVSPGGGFLHGARAQEEYLCRSSALYVTLQGNPMYAEHAASGHFESSDTIIVSPDVPVFRDDTGEALDQPWLCSFLTGAAPVAPHVGLDRSAALMERRIHRLLSVAAHEGYDALVLGAWGCGAFGNDTVRVAGTFAHELAGPFEGVFDTVVFAITDWSSDRRFLGPFARAFAG